MADQTLDVIGMNCPLPILKAKKMLNTMQQNQTLEILATDPGAVADFEAFCRTTGNTLVEAKELGDVFSFVIERTA